MKKSTEEDNIEELQLEGDLPSDIDPRMKLSPCDFMCEDCGLCNSNLWLNLSDGKILCGRKYREGVDLIRPSFLKSPQTSTSLSPSLPSTRTSSEYDGP